MWFATKSEHRKRKALTVTLGEVEVAMLDDLAHTFNASRSRVVCAALRLLSKYDSEERWRAFDRAGVARGRGTRPEGWDFTD
jgi:hypothetical protein